MCRVSLYNTIHYGDTYKFPFPFPADKIDDAISRILIIGSLKAVSASPLVTFKRQAANAFNLDVLPLISNRI